MKIAYMGVKGLPSKSGTERVIEAITTRLAGKVDMTVYCAADYTPPETQYEGVKLIRIPTFKGKHLKPILFDVFSAIHAFLFGDYDVIHMNGVENCFTLPLLCLRYTVISTTHGMPGRLPIAKWNRLESFLQRLAEYPFYYLSNYVTAISMMDTKYIQDQYGRNAIYIPNGVDVEMPVDQESALTYLRQLGISPQKFLMFAAGRIIQRKGAHILLEAFSSLNLDIPLIVLGDLDQVPEYGQKLRDLAHDHHVIFMPPIEEESLLFGILGLCKLFIFPSTAEGMSIMLLEAASLGIPMICSDIPENTSVLEDHALYFRSGDAHDLAEKIQNAMAEPEKLLDLARGTKKWIRDHYSWDLIAAQYQVLYQKCVNRERVVAEMWNDGLS